MTTQLQLPLPSPKAPWNGQMEIGACGTNVSLRYSFQVPVYGGRKGDKLAGFKLVRIVRANLIAEEDLQEFCGGDVNKLAQDFMRSTIKRLVEREGLPSEAHITFRGIDFCHHRPMTKPEENDPRWV